MSDYKKTAKDLAFDRERLKLQKQIKKLKEENRKLVCDVESREAINEHLEECLELAEAEIKSLKSMFDIPKDELEQYIRNENEKVAREKRGMEAVETLKKLTGLCRGFY